jgi:hypothetical protein
MENTVEIERMVEIKWGIWKNKEEYEGIEGNMGGFWMVGVELCGIVTAHALYIMSYHNNLLCDPPLSEYNEYLEFFEFFKFSDNLNFLTILIFLNFLNVLNFLKI